MFTLLMFFQTAFSINVLIFNKGEHIVIPKHCQYSKSLMVEMWGAGGSGNICNGRGGSSGGYVMFNISSNDQIFLLTVGKGGNSSIASKCFESGENTTFISYDNKTIISAGGGFFNHSGTPFGGINDIEKTTGTILKNIDGNEDVDFESCGANQLNGFRCSQNCDPGFTTTFSYCGNSGANAPYGGGGAGTGINYGVREAYSCAPFMQNGMFAKCNFNAGAGTLYQFEVSGGDGMVKIYY